METRFLLSTDCKIVTGENGILLYDLGRQRYIPLSQKMKDVIVSFNSLCYIENPKEEVDFIDFLVKEEYGFYISRNLITCFSEIRGVWLEPSSIHSVSIELERIFTAAKVLNYIFADTCCTTYTLIIDSISVSEFVEFQSHMSLSFSPTIDFIFLDGSDLSLVDIKDWISNTPYVNSVQVYSCRSIGLDILNNCTITMSNMAYKKTNKVVSKDNFFVNIKFFNEAKMFNPAFYKKVYIDRKLKVKRYVNDIKDFGSLFDVSFQDLIKNENFTELWYLNKDLIDQCRSCKFRYMCLDDNIPVLDNDNWKYLLECKQYNN